MAWFEAPSGEVSTPGAPQPEHDAGAERSPLDRVRDAVSTPANAELASLLEDSHRNALQVAAGAGGGSTGAELAAIAYASDAIVTLAAEGELTSADAHATAAALAGALHRDLLAMRFILLSTAIANPRLLQLPPLAAAGIQLRLLLDLGLFQGVSLWRRAVTGQPECVLQLGPGEVGRRTRSEARAVLRGRSSLRLVGRGSLRSAPIVRFDQVVGAVIAQTTGEERERAPAILAAAAAALGPVLERELLLDRSRARERALVASAERRLMRLGFDLHDGPIQDVLALAADVSHLQQQLYPFMLESHRELAFGRFDDLKARLGEVDRALREIAHSLESKSIVSRPLGEILHREVDAFAERSGIDARLDVRGDPESLSSSQRVALFRAVQEALANVREHSGATEVEIRLRARRSSIDVRITDNGAGFEVSHALARAAKRGRLGVVGIGERVRMLGGTFDLDSQPGGPTTLALTLPRVQPEDV
jgi:signal transduction histidine kinase